MCLKDFSFGGNSDDFTKWNSHFKYQKKSVTRVIYEMRHSTLQLIELEENHGIGKRDISIHTVRFGRGY